MAHAVCLGAREVPVRGALLLARVGELGSTDVDALASCAERSEDRMALDILLECVRCSPLTLVATPVSLNSVRVGVMLRASPALVSVGATLAASNGLRYALAWLGEGGGSAALLSVRALPRSLSVSASFTDACRDIVIREGEPFSLQAPHAAVESPCCSLYVQGDRLRRGPLADRRGTLLVGERSAGKTFAALSLLDSVPLPTVVLVRDSACAAYWRTCLRALSSCSTAPCTVVLASHARAVKSLRCAARAVLDCDDVSPAALNALHSCSRVLLLSQLSVPARAHALLDLPPEESLKAYAVHLPVALQRRARVRALLVAGTELVDRAAAFAPRGVRSLVLNRTSSARHELSLLRRALPSRTCTRSVPADAVCAVCHEAPSAPAVRCPQCGNAFCYACVAALKRCPLCRDASNAWELLEPQWRADGAHAPSGLLHYTLRDADAAVRALRAWRPRAKVSAVLSDSAARGGTIAVVSRFYVTLCSLATALKRAGKAYAWFQNAALCDGDDVLLIPASALASTGVYARPVQRAYVMEPNCANEGVIARVTGAEELVYVAHRAELQ